MKLKITEKPKKPHKGKVKAVARKAFGGVYKK